MDSPLISSLENVFPALTHEEILSNRSLITPVTSRRGSPLILIVERT